MSPAWRNTVSGRLGPGPALTPSLSWSPRVVPDLASWAWGLILATPRQARKRAREGERKACGQQRTHLFEGKSHRGSDANALTRERSHITARGCGGGARGGLGPACSLGHSRPCAHHEALPGALSFLLIWETGPRSSPHPPSFSHQVVGQKDALWPRARPSLFLSETTPCYCGAPGPPLIPSRAALSPRRGLRAPLPFPRGRLAAASL